MIHVYLHCSASTFGNAAEIEKWHLNRKFDGIGYHLVILNGKLSASVYHERFDGHVETGRPFDSDSIVSTKERGAHVLGHNDDSIGICLIGESGTFTLRQMTALVETLEFLREQFGSVQIFQHSDVDKRKPHCAGLDMAKLYADIASYRYHRNDVEIVSAVLESQKKVSYLLKGAIQCELYEMVEKIYEDERNFIEIIGEFADVAGFIGFSKGEPFEAEVIDTINHLLVDSRFRPVTSWMRCHNAVVGRYIRGVAQDHVSKNQRRGRVTRPVGEVLSDLEKLREMVLKAYKKAFS